MHKIKQFFVSVKNWWIWLKSKFVPIYKVTVSFNNVWGDSDDQTFTVRKIITQKEKFLKLAKNSEGYLTANLCKNGSRKTVKVHVVVALAFLGERPKSCVICHGEKGKLNNAVFNLRYDTLEANEKDKIRDKTSQHIFELMGFTRAVLSEDDVIKFFFEFEKE